MKDGAQFATAVLAIVFAAAVVVSSQLFLGYCSTRNAASPALPVVDLASAPRAANAGWIRRTHGR